ncbi:MAG: tetratricopeptide repeat protein, partial [Actinobacteria bacterium]|nr:tetratricopeptide repeat protein [Actinomycetota bacterium]
DGQIRRPPEWDRLVKPLVRACTGDDERAVAEWRRRHHVLVAVYSELTRQGRQDRPDDAPRSVGAPRVVPAQLPGDVDVFTGRAAELAELDRLLTAIPTQTNVTEVAGGYSTSVVISAVSGTAGVGKTALALRWAHRVRAEFPDGQLYVNLRGYDPDQPLSAADALAGFLRALGVAGADIPLELEERAAAYRSLLDGRRMLIVLDNAATVEQVRPLLPGTPSALVVATSRDSLTGLVARHGARRLDLDLLPPEDAVALLGALIGERVAAEPAAAALLVGQCARLPLALRIAAELAATRPASSLAQLVCELADEQRRLESLDAGGDPRTAVRAVFSWSYLHLPADAARAFRLIGLHPGPDLDPYAAAALTHTSLDQAQHLLDLLVRGHLITSTSPGRYGMHDLLRAYATDRATTDDFEDGRWSALMRLFDHYLATAAAVMNTLYPAEQHRRPRIPPPARPSPPVADPTVARDWLDAERATLTATCAHTASRGWPGYTTRLASTLFRYLDVGSHYPDALTIHTHARHAARDTGDPSAEAHALTNLDLVYERQGRYQQATEHHQQALALFRELGDRVGEARPLGNLGLVYERQGRYQQATNHYQQALALFREIGDRVGEAHALRNLGVVYERQGRYQQATNHHQQALALFREIGYRAGEAAVLNDIGETHHATGELHGAHSQHTAALTLATQIGDRYEQARAHNGLAHTHHITGELDQARHHWHQALALYTDLGVPEADDINTHLTALDQATEEDNED